MPFIAKHSYSDWCHICGKRSSPTVDVWYPQNAEHATEEEHACKSWDAKYLRLCVLCAGGIQRVATGNTFES